MKFLDDVKDLVLIGGGHSHAIALRLFGQYPLPNLRLTLISDVSHTPYSGMLPGHIAGFYSFDECHIDLIALAHFAQAQLYLDHAIGLDLKNRQVWCANRPPVHFDYLSIDIGSTPSQTSVTGVNEYAIPAKPVPQFLNRWHQLLHELSQNPDQPMSLAIVGGGAGGVELAMTMQQHLQQILILSKMHPSPIKIHLFHRGSELMPGYNSWVRQRVYQLLVERGIHVHLEETVCEVTPDQIRCQSGLTVESNYTVWVTQASAPNWIRTSGLETDANGFVLVNDNLQSLSDSSIFAAGDIATMSNYSRPKAGVFAVRQGNPLFNNLRAIVLGKPLKRYYPQKRYLSLIGTGDGNAIASWGCWGWQSPWLWRWKDYIDRQFMAQFRPLP